MHWRSSDRHRSAHRYLGVLCLHHHHDIRYHGGLYPQNPRIITTQKHQWTLSRASTLYPKSTKMTSTRTPQIHLTNINTNKSNNGDPPPDLPPHLALAALSAVWCILSLEHSKARYISSYNFLSLLCTPWAESWALSLVLFGYDLPNGRPTPVQGLDLSSHL
jgi:hypothetical protein